MTCKHDWRLLGIGRRDSTLQGYRIDICVKCSKLNAWLTSN